MHCRRLTARARAPVRVTSAICSAPIPPRSFSKPGQYAAVRGKGVEGSFNLNPLDVGAPPSPISLSLSLSPAPPSYVTRHGSRQWRSCVDPPKTAFVTCLFMRGADHPHRPAQTTQSKNHNFWSVAQEAMLTCATINQFQLSPRSIASRRFPVGMLNAVLNEETGELMEYRQVRKCPKYRKLYAKSYSK